MSGEDYNTNDFKEKDYIPDSTTSCSLCGVSYGAGSFSRIGSTPQISRAYWVMVLSEENFPEEAILISDIFIHASWFWNSKNFSSERKRHSIEFHVPKAHLKQAKLWNNSESGHKNTNLEIYSTFQDVKLSNAKKCIQISAYNGKNSWVMTAIIVI